VRLDRVALQRLRDESEKAKIRLSSVERFDFLAPFLALDPSTARALDLVDAIDRDELEALTADLVERARAPCERAMKTAKKTAREIDDVVLVGGMTAMPALRRLVVDVFGREPRTDISSEECVAMGAAIMAAALEGELRKMNISQPTTASLGVADGEGLMAVLVKAKTPTPVRKSAKFTTVRDNQTRVAVRLREGELEMADDVRDLGVMILDGIRPAPAGEPTIEVVFDVDNDQVLTVTATDVGTGAAVEAAVHVQTGLSKAEFRRLKAVA
jgi:molecular chaperone DnaK